MENTSVISPNGTPYGTKENVFKSSSNLSTQKSALRFDPRSGFINPGGMYTIGSGMDGQLLMNTHSLTTATTMQFMIPTRAKSNIPMMEILKLSAVSSSAEMSSNVRSTDKLSLEHHDTNKSICDEKSSLEQETTESNSVFSTIKTLFSYCKTMLVGSVNNVKTTPKPILGEQMYWDDSDSFINSHKPTTKFNDNHSSDSFSYSNEKSNMPETYFDCDDYIEGGEDTIDFIADSTKYYSYSDDYTADMPVHPSTKEPNSLDCINKEAAVSETPPLSSTPPLPSIEPLEDDTKPDSNATEQQLTEIVQYNEEIAKPMNCPKNDKSNRNTYRRKRRGKRKHKPAVQRKKSASNKKNRHEKIRHEVEMNIHEDIDDCLIEENHSDHCDQSDDSFIVFEECSPKSTTSSVDSFIPKYTTQADSYRRQRQLSECSDDFILFTDDIEDCLQSQCYTTDEDFTDSTDDSDCSDDESSDDSDSEFISAVSKGKDDHNQPDSGFEEKKVTFNLCPIVHEIRAWKFAYSEARKGKWEQLGRDRERFEKRINELSRILTPVLAAKHRQKIFEQRFQCEE